jgi:hypothetical protein
MVIWYINGRFGMLYRENLATLVPEKNLQKTFVESSVGFGELRR